MNQQEFEAKLQAAVGLSRGPYLGWDAVNRAMIRHWCEAMGDTNPAYVNAEAAAEVGGRDGGVVAPATMLQAWTMVGYGNEHPDGSDTQHPVSVLDMFDEAGFKAVVATNCEQEYFLQVCEGDELRNYSSIESISGQKTTSLGVGYFVTQLMEFKNQRDELVGVMRFRILKYKPH